MAPVSRCVCAAVMRRARHRPVHYCWEWRLRSAPRALWPYVADTNRFNRDSGVPHVERVGGTSAASGARRRLRFRRMGVSIEWEEEPFEWAWPHRFGVVRRYMRGPMTELRVLVELQPEASGGTRLIYQVWAEPHGVLGRLAIPVEIGWRFARALETAVRRYDALALAPPGESPLPVAAGSVSTVATERLTAGQAALRLAGVDPDLIARLASTLTGADDLTLLRIRPYALADAWGADRRAVLELCLAATRAGLLDLRWDLLCPLCRGAQASPSSLRDLTSSVHCETCRIDFTADLERLVEVTFRPNPAIRPVEDREFCVGSPQRTPHVVVQQLLAPGARRVVSLTLEEGRYRIRALGQPGTQLLRVAPDGRAEATAVATSDGWAPGETVLAPTVTLGLENRTNREQLLLIERLAWTDQAATAAEVIVLQAFRDLFSREVLRAGERIAVGQVTLVFTDLRGSTRLYREVGDAPAFGHVMNHFDVIRKAVAEEGGGIVKTIGDAVMAAFHHPAAALRAALRAQGRLADSGQAAPPLPLRVGIHTGPCIAVTLNDRLDYFGSTVNLAARLEGLSTAHDIIVSDAVAMAPDVSAWLATEADTLSIERFETTLKGFDTERFTVCRIRRCGSSDTAPASRVAGSLDAEAKRNRGRA
jgi:class 3 adenylate cyclase